MIVLVPQRGEKPRELIKFQRTLDAKNRISLPGPVCDALGLRPGEDVDILVMSSGEFLIRRPGEQRVCHNCLATGKLIKVAGNLYCRACALREMEFLKKSLGE